MMRREALCKGMRVRHDAGWIGVVICPDQGTSFNQVCLEPEPEYRGHPMFIPSIIWVDHQDLNPIHETKP